MCLSNTNKILVKFYIHKYTVYFVFYNVLSESNIQKTKQKPLLFCINLILKAKAPNSKVSYIHWKFIVDF